MNIKETGIFGRGEKRNHIFVTSLGVSNRKKMWRTIASRTYNDVSSYSGLTMIKTFSLVQRKQ